MLAGSRRLITIIVAIGWLAAGATYGQTIEVVDNAKLPRFEVASVKLSDPGATFGRFGFPPGRFVQENTPLFPSTIGMAFGVSPYQVAGPLPDFLTRERFTINASMPAGAPVSDRALMVRALLVDRFKLRYHVERRDTDGFALTIARRDGTLGSQLRPSTADCAARMAARTRNEPPAPMPPGAAECGVRNGPGLIQFGGMPVQSLVTMLSNQVGKPVVDQTQLPGSFDVDLRFASVGPRPENSLAPVDEATSLFTAVQEQLGLKLTPARVPMDRLVVDHVERPDPD
jgi:uncharacterized protein (TIGR03435 family)